MQSSIVDRWKHRIYGIAFEHVYLLFMAAVGQYAQPATQDVLLREVATHLVVLMGFPNNGLCRQAKHLDLAWLLFTFAVRLTRTVFLSLNYAFQETE